MEANKKIALHQSMTCFVNSLAREWNGFVKSPSPSGVIAQTQCAESLRVDIPDAEPLWIPLKKFSLLGKHQFGESFFQGGENPSPVDFFKAVRQILPLLLGDEAQAREKIEIFMSRLENSEINMQEALLFRHADLEKIYRGDYCFSSAEQALMIGHNFHPYPKMREGFNDEDYRRYSPEMAGHFSLQWFLVRPEMLFQQTAASFTNSDWLKDLFQNEAAKDKRIQSALQEGFVPFPVHPWQKANLLKHPEIQEKIRSGDMLDAGVGQRSWQPTSSLRSVFSPKAPFMLKFSLTLRLTNSIRHLTPVEVVRGQQVHDVLASPRGREFLAKFPSFQVITEPAFAALKNAQGEMMTDSIVVCRENPFREDPTHLSVVSTLTQDSPVGGDNLIRRMVLARAKKTGRNLQTLSREWFQKYIKNAVQPLVQAQCNYGILLGAHQQNLLLQIQDDEPVAAFFRDCQGTGYSQVGYEMFKPAVASLQPDNGNVLDHRGNYLFAYYLIINSTFNVIAALACDERVSEELLLQDLRAFLLQTRRENPRDKSCLDYLLEQKEILQKGNFHCSLQNINENTTANPLAIYNPIANPLWIGPGGL